MKPLISVIMSTYNEARYIRQSLDSILHQSEKDFEIILIDDCSQDETVQIIQRIQDERIRLICNSENLGLTKNLNIGLGLAKGKYIARMDGDDISVPDRFKKQEAYMEAHPEIMLVGCQTKNFGESSLVWRLKDDSEELKVRMLIRPVYAHPGFFMRRELIDAGYRYDESFRTAQDYEFASRVAERNSIGLVEEVLLYYRVHRKQVSNQAGEEQFSNADRVRERSWERVGMQFSEEQKKLMQKIIREERDVSVDTLLACGEVLGKIVEANRKTEVYEQEVLEKTLKKVLYTWAIRSKNIKNIVSFPKLCGYHMDNMILFLGEGFRTIHEKILNRRMHEISDFMEVFK